MPTFTGTYTARVPGILIVDPDLQVCVDLTRGLTAQGWRVWATTDASAAFEIYQLSRNGIEVALIDLQFPGPQGGEVLAELAKLNPNLLRCAMTADINPYSAAVFRRVNATPLFTKPLSIRALSFTLYEMLIPVPRR